MVGIDISCYLEDKTCKFLLFRLDITLFCFRGTRTWSYLHKTVQQFLHTEVIECRTEEHRSHLSRTICFHIKLRVNTIDKFQILTKLCRILVANSLIKFLAIDINLYFFSNSLFVRSKEVEFILIDIIYTLELCSLVNRP